MALFGVVTWKSMKVFISHSVRDSDLARTISDGLRKEGLEVWLPENEILPGDNWAERVSDALNQCDAMVALLTAGGLETDNVQWEMGFALGNKAYKQRLIPVLVGRQTDPAHLMPWILERFKVIRLPEPEHASEAVREIAGALMAAA